MRECQRWPAYGCARFIRQLFGKWSGTEVKLEGEDLIIMKESDVLGVLS